MPSARSTLRLHGLAAVLALAATLGCVDHESGGGLYLFDNATRSVKVWRDIGQLHGAARDGGELPQPVRTIRSSLFGDLNLAWGGMALDGFRHRLYLVSVDGKVLVVTDPAHRDGDLSRPTDILSFTLGGSTDRFPGGSVFGQAALDQGQDILYVVETARDGEETRIWQVANASKVLHRHTVPKDDRNTLKAEGDKRGAGVAAGPGHRVYVLFGGGDVHEDDHGHQTLRGSRLRLGSNGAIKASQPHQRPMDTLIGPETRLPETLDYGSLAYDGRHHALYVLVPPRDEAEAAILVFGQGQFHGRHDQPPRHALPEPPQDLRILAFPQDSDWLLGAAGTASKGQGQLYIWKAPHEGGGHVKAADLPGVTDLRGMAAGN